MAARPVSLSVVARSTAVIKTYGELKGMTSRKSDEDGPCSIGHLLQHYVPTCQASPSLESQAHPATHLCQPVPQGSPQLWCNYPKGSEPKLDLPNITSSYGPLLACASDMCQSQVGLTVVLLNCSARNEYETKDVRHTAFRKCTSLGIDS
jgi:hypothetical protein